MHQNNRRLGAIGLVGFGSSLLVHVLTVLRIDVSSAVPLVWVLHVAVLLYFAVFVFSSWAAVGTRLRWDIMRDHLPGWVTLGYVTALAYFAFNFVLCANLTGSGNADIVNGEYLLTSHGHILAHLTEVEYHLHKAYELRMFSGGWMLFWIIPLGYFFFWQHHPVRSTDRLIA